MRIFKTRLRVHPLTPLSALLACRLGMRRQVLSLMIALFIHESAHLVAAACARIPIPEIRLMPFGGAASIGNPYAVSPIRLGVTAAAGPVSGMLAACVTALLARWGAIDPENAALFIRTNIILTLFNLIPALPLDGGRILYALTREKLGPERAVSVGLWAGRVSAVLLVGCAARLWFARGVLNVSYLFAAVFLIASAPGERSALISSNVRVLLSALSPVSGPAPVSLCAVDAGCSARAALKSARPDAVNLYIVYENGAPAHLTDDRALVSLCLAHSGSPSVGEARMAFVPETLS